MEATETDAGSGVMSYWHGMVVRVVYLRPVVRIHSPPFDRLA